MRYTCETEGLTANWVDVSDVWTRGEILEYGAAQDPELELEWLQRKLTACHIETVGGAPITDPAGLTLEAVNDCDLRLFWFLGAVINKAVNDMRMLNPLPKRLSSEKPGATAK